jgi:hypothetical protein
MRHVCYSNVLDSTGFPVVVFLLARIGIRFTQRGQAVAFSLFPVHSIIQVYSSSCNCREAHASYSFLECIVLLLCLMIYSIGLVVEVYVLVSSKHQ